MSGRVCGALALVLLPSKLSDCASLNELFVLMNIHEWRRGAAQGIFIAHSSQAMADGVNDDKYIHVLVNTLCAPRKSACADITRFSICPVCVAENGNKNKLDALMSNAFVAVGHEYGDYAS